MSDIEAADDRIRQQEHHRNLRDRSQGSRVDEASTPQRSDMQQVAPALGPARGAMGIRAVDAVGGLPECKAATTRVLPRKQLTCSGRAPAAAHDPKPRSCGAPGPWPSMPRRRRFRAYSIHVSARRRSAALFRRAAPRNGRAQLTRCGHALQSGKSVDVAIGYWFSQMVAVSTCAASRRHSGSHPEAVAAVSRTNEHFVAGVDDGRRRDRHRCGLGDRCSRAAALWR